MLFPRSATRVLVVDDEEAIRLFASRALSQGGYEVITAASARDALEIVDRDARFDAVVTDVKMPDVTGVELGLALRSRDPEIRILYFTGYADRMFDAKGTLGVHEAFIEKPVSIGALLEAVSLLVFGHTRGPEHE